MKLLPLLRNRQLSKLHLNRNLSKSLLLQSPLPRKPLLPNLQLKKLLRLSLHQNPLLSLLRNLPKSPLLKSLLSNHLQKRLQHLLSLTAHQILPPRKRPLLHRNRKLLNHPLKSPSLLLRRWKLLLRLLLLQSLRRKLQLQKKRQLPMHPRKPQQSQMQHLRSRQRRSLRKPLPPSQRPRSLPLKLLQRRTQWPTNPQPSRKLRKLQLKRSSPK
jgi:hypothetical protein